MSSRLPRPSVNTTCVRSPHPLRFSHKSMTRRAAGLGLKAEHFNHIHEHQPEVGFFEVHAENHLVPGEPMLRHLTQIREN
jgi:uncharacterized protein